MIDETDKMRIETAEIHVADDLPALVKPGTYIVRLDHFETAVMFNGKAPKLILTFAVEDLGSAFGKRLPRYYNVANLVGRPGIGGKFKASRKGDFLREYCSLFSNRISRLDRLPMSEFKNKSIKVEVVTVKESRGRVIPEPLRYSKIARLIKVAQ